MITITLQQAKAKLNQLVDKALAGESVVLMRGSKIVATIQPLSEADLEISTRLTDKEASAYWQQVDKEKKKSFKSAKVAVNYLKRSRT